MERLDWIRKNVGSHEEEWYREALEVFNMTIEFFETERRPTADGVYPKTEMTFFTTTDEPAAGIVRFLIVVPVRGGLKKAKGYIKMSEGNSFSGDIKMKDHGLLCTGHSRFKTVVFQMLSYATGIQKPGDLEVKYDTDLINWSFVGKGLRTEIETFISARSAK